MRKDLVGPLTSKIKELREILEKIDIEQILGSIANDLTLTPKDQDLHSKTKLSSPYRQYLYLYGLAVSTKQISNQPVNQRTWEKIKKLLEEIVIQHTLIFFPSEEEFKKGLSEEWKRTREISMPVFLSYFNIFELNYEEQVIDRINRWFMPFNDILKKETNCSVKELLDIYSCIRDYIQQTFDEITDLAEREKEIRLKFIDEYFTDDRSIEEIRKIAQSHPVKKAAFDLLNKIKEVYRFKIADLYSKFDRKFLDSFISVFSIEREERPFQYYTEENPVVKSPLFRIDENNLFCVCHKLLLFSIYKFIYDSLENSTVKERFFRQRDAEAENQTLDIFRSLFKGKGDYYSSLYETPKAEFEHDCLIMYGSDILIIEVKAGKIKEPFRDPEKAFVRISRDFNDDSGIQSAYNQALHLKKSILSKEQTSLYDEKGRIMVELNRNDIRTVYIICVTAEPFGIIASNLSLLLNKPESEDYPWCCNLYDLDTFINAINHLGLTAEDFIYYISKRSELHRKLMATDELEIAGYFLSYKSFKDIEEKKFDVMFFTPDMSNIFDKIYFEKRGIPYSLEQDEKPAMINIREELSKTMNFNKRLKVGRNDPCPCGSGRKYKKCCGK